MKSFNASQKPTEIYLRRFIVAKTKHAVKPKSSIAETTWKYLIWIGIYFQPANSHLPNNGQFGIHDFGLEVSYS